MSPHKSFLLVVILLAFGMSQPAAEAGQIPLPDDFIGIWQGQGVVRDCTTQVIIGQFPVGPDTVCSGSTFDPSNGQYPVDCTGSANGNTFTLHCTGSFQVDENCVANLTYDVSGTKNGTTWTSTITSNTDYVGTSCPIQHSCSETTITTTLINPDPSCASPVEPGTWGEIKHRYRS